jgi:hypothetical protein
MRIFAYIGMVALGLCVVGSIGAGIYWLMPPRCADGSVLQALENEFGEIPGVQGLRIKEKLFHSTDFGKDDKGRQECYSTFTNVFGLHGVGLRYTIINKNQVEITDVHRL